MNNIRVRFAPSPTGHLHLGGLRAAIFNWLFARHNNGKFLLRIEDTDRERSKPEYLDSIIKALAWTDIASDEPLVVQSERLAIYKEIAESMVAAGTAYRCYCIASSEESYSKYAGTCRETDCTTGGQYAIRFKIPADVTHVSFHDLIHGEIKIDRDQLDDFILLRSDGTPLYNFVVVIDDAFMRITHILRGEEHIPNTPKQILLYQALGYALPEFGHLPLILGPDGSKLSKRDAATAVIDYKNSGFLSDALFNYLVRLGWSHGDQEIFTKSELIKYFSLDHVGKKGSIFDIKKLEWMNGVYIRATSSQDLLKFIIDLDPTFAKKVDSWPEKKLLALIDLYKERVKTLRELIEELISLHDGPRSYEVQVDGILSQVQEILAGQVDFSADNLSAVLKDFCKNNNLKLPAIAIPLRVAITGKTSSPGIFEILALLGKEVCLSRIEKFKKSGL